MVYRYKAEYQTIEPEDIEVTIREEKGENHRDAWLMACRMATLHHDDLRRLSFVGVTPVLV